MGDWYRTVANNRVGSVVTGRLGLPRPANLRRHKAGQELLAGAALVGPEPAGRLADPIRALLAEAGATVRRDDRDDGGKLAAVIADATDVSTVDDLARVAEFLAPAFRRLAPSGRLLVVGGLASKSAGAEEVAARGALIGLVRSAGKEARAGATVNLVRVAEKATDAALSPVRFLLSARSAYVSGQVIDVEPAETGAKLDENRPLDGRIVVVTGAARGIGAAIAEVAARDGATVVCVDIPAAGERLTAVANRIGGVALQLDITAENAPDRLIEHLRSRHGGLDVLVHNAGITRDKLLVNMTPEKWSSVLAVNLQAQLRINAALLATKDVLRPQARIVSVSSTSGIAGNRGQTNYAASKAGVIAMVRAQAPAFARRGATINAVAPGFIETEMTAAMPIGVREAGRRINSLNQGGLPVDVAETICWLGRSDSGGVNGQVIRVCGQSMLGA